MAFIAGQYTATLGGSPVGQIEAGITIEHFVNKRLVTGDNQGDTPQDAIHRGHEYFAEFILMEYDVAVLVSVWNPYGAYGAQGVVGAMDIASSNVASLVLTAISNTTASASPASVIATRCILAEGFPVRILFAPDLRDMPIRLRMYQAAAGTFFTVT